MMRASGSRGWIVLLPGAGSVVLLAALVFGWLQTRASAELLLRGEADQHLERAHDGVLALRGPPTDARLRALLERGGDSGLLYLAAVTSDEQLVAASGPLPAELGPPHGFASMEPQRVGAYGCVRSRPMPRVTRPGRIGERPPPLAPGPPGLGSDTRPGPGGLSLLLCFEPRLVAQVDRAANVMLAAGLAGGCGLLGLSLFARRLLGAREDMIQAMEEQRRLAGLGTMSAVIAHELRNPLASLKGHAQLLEEGLEGQAKLRAQAKRVVEGALRLELLSGSLLELARLGTLAPEVIHPAALLRASISALDATRVDVDDAQAPARWLLDPVRFQQVVTNLVDNALQAAPHERVTVTLALARETLVLEVCDRGPGVPAADRARILEPFVTHRARGVGLGLAITQHIVVLHGGKLSVLDAEGGGARFRIELPKLMPTMTPPSTAPGGDA